MFVVNNRISLYIFLSGSFSPFNLPAYIFITTSHFPMRFSLTTFDFTSLKKIARLCQPNKKKITRVLQKLRCSYFASLVHDISRISAVIQNTYATSLVRLSYQDIIRLDQAIGFFSLHAHNYLLCVDYKRFPYEHLASGF